VCERAAGRSCATGQWKSLQQGSNLLLPARGGQLPLCCSPMPPLLCAAAAACRLPSALCLFTTYPLPLPTP